MSFKQILILLSDFDKVNAVTITQTTFTPLQLIFVWGNQLIFVLLQGGFEREMEDGVELGVFFVHISKSPLVLPQNAFFFFWYHAAWPGWNFDFHFLNVLLYCFAGQISTSLPPHEGTSIHIYQTTKRTQIPAFVKAQTVHPRHFNSCFFGYQFHKGIK